MFFPKSWIFLIAAFDICPLSVATCLQPSSPSHGEFRPKRSFYSEEEMVNYSCNGNRTLFGVAERRCQSNGEWSGKVPFCDLASNSEIKSSAQSTTLHHFEANLAYDGDFSTCSTTGSNGKQSWSGYLKEEVFVFVIRIFVPRGPVSVKVVLRDASNILHVCGNLNSIIVSDPGEWKTIFCNEKGLFFAIKDKSNLPQPVKLCEVQLVTWKDGDGCSTPPSSDNIEGGRAIISHKEAIVMCDEGYHSNSYLKCISGTWQNGTLKCEKRVTELSTKYTSHTTGDYDKKINTQDPNNVGNHSNAGSTSNVIIIVASVAVVLAVSSLVLGCLALMRRKRNTASSTSTTSTATMNTTIGEDEGPPVYELMLYEEIPDSTPTLHVTNKPTWELPEIPSQEPITLDPYYSQPIEENATQPCCLYYDTDHSAPYVDTEPQDAYKEPSGKCFGHTNCDRNKYTFS